MALAAAAVVSRIFAGVYTAGDEAEPGAEESGEAHAHAAVESVVDVGELLVVAHRTAHLHALPRTPEIRIVR